MTRAPDVKLDTYTTNRSSVTETDRINTTQQLRPQNRDVRNRGIMQYGDDNDNDNNYTHFYLAIRS